MQIELCSFLFSSEVYIFQDNILVSPSGEPLICDFGISHMIAVSQSFGLSGTQTGTLRGTTRYMSIELIEASEDGKYTKASDIWAFAITIMVRLLSSFNEINDRI